MPTCSVVRRVAAWLHRWVGLLMAGFLIIVGLTGSLLAFNSELERLISPQLYATPRPGVAPLDLATLAERAETLVPQARVEGVLFTEADQAVIAFVARNDPTTGNPYNLGFTQFFVDPWTGEELGRRIRGDLSQGLVNLMPFIYKLHWELALGTIGFWILGIVSVVWTIDCFVGFYLTLPVAIDGFWERWKPSWLVKWRAGFFRINFDLHRASGLWLWPMLFIFAWSSVMMDMRPAYEWVTKRLFDYRSPIEDFSSVRQNANGKPRLDWRAARAVGEQLMAEQALSHGFILKQPLGLSYSSDFGAYIYEARSSRDVFERAPKGGSTFIMFDGDTGTLLRLFMPTGEHSGDTVESWLYALHMTRVFGRAYQIFVCVLGLVITMLSATGVYIWWKKRRARSFSKIHRRKTASEFASE
ncbi:MAG: PepSY-associated TM helix domain-containing protein [Methylocella sp.]